MGEQRPGEEAEKGAVAAAARSYSPLSTLNPLSRSTWTCMSKIISPGPRRSITAAEAYSQAMEQMFPCL